MKIAIIRRKFTPFGGAENFILRMSSSLTSLGIKFSIISEAWKGNSKTTKNISWLKAKSFGLTRYSRFVSFKHSVKKIIKAHHFDLVQSHERLMGADIFRIGDGVHAAWIDRVKKISPWYKKIWLNIDPYHIKIIRTEKRMSHDKNLFFVANSELVKNELLKYYKIPQSRVRVIENGIDVKSFQPITTFKKEQAKRKLALDPKSPVILFVGSGFERKGAFELVEAIKLLPKFQSIIVGRDKKIEALKALASDKRILITGPQVDIQPYLDASDIFCLPSMYDSLPNAALEALCCGLPVVVTKDVGLFTHIKKYNAGVICNKNIQSIAKALVSAWKKRKLFSKNALKLAKTFDSKLKNTEWKWLYSELLTKKKFKILHTESSLGWGGQEIRVLTEAKIFVQNGHEVIIAADKNSLISKHAQLYNVKCIPIKLQKKRFSDLLALRALIKKENPDIISCHSSTDHWLSALARLTLNVKPAIVRTRHISTIVHRNIPTKWLYNCGCESIMTTSESIKRNLKRDGFIKTLITSVPTGIDTEKYILGNKQQQRKILNLPKNDFIFGIVATLRSWKGHTDLIQAFNLLNNPKCSLVIVGDGPQMVACKYLSKKNKNPEKIIFTGNIHNVVPYYQAIDCFVLPSYANEGVPQALLQAMSLGLPIISCPTGGIPEILKLYKNSVLIEPKNINLLAKTMVRFTKKRINQKEKIYQPYSLKDLFLTSYKIYSNVIKIKKRNFF